MLIQISLSVLFVSIIFSFSLAIVRNNPINSSLVLESTVKCIIVKRNHRKTFNLIYLVKLSSNFAEGRNAFFYNNSYSFS